MGNCLAHDSPSRPRKSRSQPAAAPLHRVPDDKPPQEAKEQPPRTPAVQRTKPAKEKRSVRFVDDIDGSKKNSNDNKKDVVRVKVVLTKKEADLLLSLLGGGGGGGVQSALGSAICKVEESEGGSRSPTRSRECGRRRLSDDSCEI
ncbi:hypothetical protein Cni_G29267 [Canna indica]|uniref:Uncharacterized protein n=1 Tax=Canna indica TaxID=4628 RepID=A0AAQ3LBB2_9LILI|nr:hypothetical protein Cni_G29267 [Canna indica]